MSDQKPERGWQPHPGDTISGRVVDIAATDLGYGVYPIISLDTGEGVKDVHAFHTVLRRELAKRRPKIGDELEVTYCGKRGGDKDRQAYADYIVHGGDVRGTYDWDSEMSEDERTVMRAASAEPPIPQEPAGVATTEQKAAFASAPAYDEPPF